MSLLTNERALDGTFRYRSMLCGLRLASERVRWIYEIRQVCSEPLQGGGGGGRSEVPARPSSVLAGTSCGGLVACVTDVIKITEVRAAMHNAWYIRGMDLYTRRVRLKRCIIAKAPRTSRSAISFSQISSCSTPTLPLFSFMIASLLPISKNRTYILR